MFRWLSKEDAAFGEMIIVCVIIFLIKFACPKLFGHVFNPGAHYAQIGSAVTYEAKLWRLATNVKQL